MLCVVAGLRGLVLLSPSRPAAVPLKCEVCTRAETRVCLSDRRHRVHDSVTLLCGHRHCGSHTHTAYPSARHRNGTQDFKASEVVVVPVVDATRARHAQSRSASANKCVLPTFFKCALRRECPFITECSAPKNIPHTYTVFHTHTQTTAQQIIYAQHNLHTLTHLDKREPHTKLDTTLGIARSPS